MLNVDEEITIKKQVIDWLWNTTPTHTKMRVWLRMSHLIKLSLVGSLFLRRHQVNTYILKGIKKNTLWLW